MAKVKLYTSEYYEDKKHEYDLFNDLMTGDNLVMRSPLYLPYHELEADKSVPGAIAIRETRESLSRYTNFPSRAFRRYKSIIFQEDPELDDEARDLLEKYKLINNIDGKGTNFFNYIKDVLFRSKFVYGDSYLLTTSENDKAIWDVPNPMLVKDTSIADGELTLFRYEYFVTEPRTRSSAKPMQMIYSDEYYLDGESVILARYKQEVKDDGKQSDEWDFVSEENITNFDKIPVVYNLGDSFIKDPANDCLEYHNLKSALMNQLYHQAFDRIIVSGEVDDDQKFALSAFTVTILRTKTGAPNATVTNIPAADTSALKDQMNEASQNVFKSFYHYNRAISSDSGNIESAESQELAKEDLLNVIKSEIEDLERQVNQGMQNLATQLGVNNYTGEIKFNKKISITNLEQELREELAYYPIIRNKFPTWEKGLLKKAAKRHDLENEEDILDEIENYQGTTTPQTIDLTNI